MMQNLPVIQRASDKIGDYLLHTKLPKLLLFLIFFSCATQLGLHFWPTSALVYGIRVDYLSPTLYFLDILIILFLSARRLFDTRPEQGSSRDAEGGRSLLVGIIPIFLVNFLYSQNPLATLNWSLHFLLYLAFFNKILNLGSSQKIGHSKETGRTLLVDVIQRVLPLTLLFHFLVALTQVYLGHSIGGVMYYLGERSIAVSQPSIAMGTFMGSVVLRAYSTFGHPNVLAGYAVVSLLILIQIREVAIPKASKPRSVRRSDPRSQRALLNRKSALSAKLFSRISKTNSVTKSDLFGIYFPLLLTTPILLLTQSRSAILTLFGLIIPFYILQTFKQRLLYYSLVLFLYGSLSSSLLSPPRADLSLSERHILQGVSLKVIQRFPIFGTGAQASISTYPSVAPENRLLQPDHNSLTLFLSWFGVFGLLALLNSFRSQFENLSIWDLRFVVPLLPLLLLDHYFLTSPQGLFIFILYSQMISLSDTPTS